MKYLLSAILLAAIALGQEAPVSSPPSQAVPADQENARKAKELLNQTIQALGGQAYLQAQDMTQEGRSYSFHLGRPNSIGVRFWRFYKYPDKDRIELTKKRDVVYVNNGDKGYQITYKGTAVMEPKDLQDYLRRRQYALDWVLRQWLNEPGVALFYDGPTVAEQKQAQQVTIMNSHNQGVILYIDASNHLPIKKSFSWRDPTDKQRNVEDEAYDNYRPVQGIMTPFSITRYYNGEMAGQRFLNSVSFNKGLNDSLFAASVTYDPHKPPAKR